MLTRIGLISALTALLVTTPALADRAGDAPIRAPLMLKTDHIAFTLPGGPWLQLVGDLGGTPSFGSYLVGGNGLAASCSTETDVSGKPVARRPTVKSGVVTLSKATSLRVTSSGSHGAVRWWAGAMKGSAASAVGVQRLPARLATKAKPYLLYSVAVHSDARAACGPFARTTAKSIARTMHVASGPAVGRPPFGD